VNIVLAEVSTREVLERVQEDVSAGGLALLLLVDRASGVREKERGQLNGSLGAVVELLGVRDRVSGRLFQLEAVAENFRSDPFVRLGRNRDGDLRYCQHAY
jgi:hypothetical protein